MTTAERTLRSLRRRTVLGAVLAMAIAAIGPAGAVRADIPADLVDLTVVDRETGQPLRTWRHDGRLFVAGQPGAHYSLRVTNHTEGRVLVVMSVDGVNIISGETAGYGQRGYVLSPYRSFDASGWRKSDTEVAAFTFAPLPQSYAARTGRAAEVGVIGLAAFKERVVPPVIVAPIAAAPPVVTPLAESRPARRAGPDSEISELVVTGSRIPSPSLAPPPPQRSARTESAARSAAPPVAEARPAEEKLGTAHGAREWSVTYTVPFERATPYPQLISRIEYDTYDNLVASGVIAPPWNGSRRPRPFPGSPDGNGYAPDPPGRP